MLGVLADVAILIIFGCGVGSAATSAKRKAYGGRKCPNCGRKSHFIHEPHVLAWDYEEEAEA